MITRGICKHLGYQCVRFPRCCLSANTRPQGKVSRENYEPYPWSKRLWSFIDVVFNVNKSQCQAQILTLKNSSFYGIVWKCYLATMFTLTQCALNTETFVFQDGPFGGVTEAELYSRHLSFSRHLKHSNDMWDLLDIIRNSLVGQSRLAAYKHCKPSLKSNWAA